MLRNRTWVIDGLSAITIGDNAIGRVESIFKMNTITIDQLQLFTETDSNLCQIDSAGVFFANTMNRRVMTQCWSNAVVQFSNGVLFVWLNISFVQQIGHCVLLKPCQTLAKVFLLRVQITKNTGTCSMLKPFMTPKWCIWFTCYTTQNID